MRLPALTAAMFMAGAASPAFAAPASTPEMEVVAAVRAWLDAFEADDKKRLAEVTHGEGAQFTARYLPNQERIRVRKHDVDLVATAPRKEQYRETFWNPTVLVRADLAQFWAPYSFDIDGKRSHCGIDNFTMMRIDGKWVMTNSSWTVELPDKSCAALGEPKR